MMHETNFDRALAYRQPSGLLVGGLFSVLVWAALIGGTILSLG